MIEIRRSAFITTAKQNDLQKSIVHDPVHEPNDNQWFDMARFMRWKIVLGFVVVTLVAIVAYKTGYQTAMSDDVAIENRNACNNNLRQLDGAIQTWASEKKKAETDIPTWADIEPYTRHNVTCPSRGTYTLGPVAGRPTCSIPDHNLPHD